MRDEKKRGAFVRGDTEPVVQQLSPAVLEKMYE